MSTVPRAYAAQARDPSLPDHWSGPPELVDRIATLLGTMRDHRVVDVASGVGGPARRLSASTGCEVVALDLVLDVLRTARESGTSRRVHLVTGGATALPLRSVVADQVWCLGAVAHVPDVAAFAREAFRILRPEGSLAITEAFWDGRHPPRFARSAPKPWRALTVSELTGALRRAGFSETRHHGWPGELKDAPPTDEGLAADLADGRLLPALVTARRA